MIDTRFTLISWLYLPTHKFLDETGPTGHFPTAQIINFHCFNLKKLNFYSDSTSINEFYAFTQSRERKVVLRTFFFYNLSIFFLFVLFFLFKTLEHNAFFFYVKKVNENFKGF